jgi:hypothetical protein
MQLAALLMIVGGAYLAYREAVPFLRGGVLAKERFDAFYEGAITPGWSTPSKQLVLDNCVDAITSIYGRTQPTERQMTVARTCQETADGATEQDPAFAYAWLVGGLAAERLGDVQGMARRLSQSAQVGPNEQWIAELRWAMLEEHYDALPSEDQRFVEHDTVLLLNDIRGAQLVADKYVRGDATFKARIKAAVETTRDVIKQRFVNSVKVSMRQVRG